MFSQATGDCLSNRYLIESEHAAGGVASSLQNSSGCHKAVTTDNILPTEIDSGRLLTTNRGVFGSDSYCRCVSLLYLSWGYIAIGNRLES